MKRQLGWILTAAALLCAPLAWAQSDSSSSSAGASTSSSTGNTGSSSQGTSTNSSQGTATTSPQGGGTNSSPDTSTTSPQGLYTYPQASPGLFTSAAPGTGTDSTQSGAGDTSQSGGGDTSQSGANGPQDTFSHPEKLPPLNLFSDVAKHTGLTLFTSVGSLTDRITEAGFHAYWNNLALINGGVSISQYRPSVLWAVSYNGGTNLSNSTIGSYYTSLTHSANANITWNFAKRWQLRVKDSYLYSNDPFQPFLTYLGQPTPNNPNPVVYVPNAVVEQNQGGVEATYRLGEHDSVNFTTGETLQRYIRSYSGQWNSFTYSGGAFYQHEFSARLSAGGGYLLQAIDFGHGTSRSGVNWFQGFVSYRFRPGLQISAWVGPQLTHSKNLIPIFCSQYGCLIDVQHRSQWSVAEGGTLKWEISHNNTLGVSLSHQISNGGGLLGVARIYTGTLTYSRPLTRLWVFDLGALYNNSVSLSNFRAEQYLKNWSGTAGVGRRLFNDAWTFNAYYAFIHQSQNYTGLKGATGSNGIGLSVRYSWNHGLGR